MMRKRKTREEQLRDKKMVDFLVIDKKLTTLSSLGSTPKSLERLIGQSPVDHLFLLYDVLFEATVGGSCGWPAAYIKHLSDIV